VVFGLGGIGLNVIQGAAHGGRRHDHRRRHQPGQEGMAEKFGMTHFVNPKEVEGDVVADMTSSS
jgi:S-(hydroxymethyl)glutathione dehydrogenase/alcohol dehydrogenase